MGEQSNIRLDAHKDRPACLQSPCYTAAVLSDRKNQPPSTKSAARCPSGVQAVLFPSDQGSGETRQALPAQFEIESVSSAKAVTPRPGCFMRPVAPVRPGLTAGCHSAAAAGPNREVPDALAAQSWTVHPRRTPDRAVKSAREPTPGLLPFEGRSPKKPVEQARGKYTPGPGERG